MSTIDKPILFWRDAQLPFIEARLVKDGRKVYYDKHTHTTFSVGAITGGVSGYFDGKTYHQTTEGTLVLINPETVHACNPIDNQPWSYLMFYVDIAWLTDLQQELGISKGDFYAFPQTISHHSILYQTLVNLYNLLINPENELLYKQTEIIHFFSLLQQHISPIKSISHPILYKKLQPVADYISKHCTQSLSLEDLCQLAQLSPYHLIRSFKKHYGMTPHSYLINRRVQYGQQLLKQGKSIIETALVCGFADQAHFQRTFKRLLASTPKQYQA